MERTTVEIGKETDISRFTLQQAAKSGKIPARQCECGHTHFIDTDTEQFKTWLAAHWNQSRVKGRKKEPSCQN